MYKQWFDNPNITQSFPPVYRFYTLYSRLMFNSHSGFVAGGTFLLKKLGKLTRLLRLRNEAMVQIDGVKAYVDLCDPRMFMVFGELQSGTAEAKIMQSLLTAGDTFIDVGANHGSFSLIAAGLVGMTGKVLAFEPQPRLASLIRKSFAANGYDNTEVYEIACSDHSGSAEFYLPENSSGAAGIYKAFSGNSAHQKFKARVVQFDDRIDWQRPSPDAAPPDHRPTHACTDCARRVHADRVRPERFSFLSWTNRRFVSFAKISFPGLCVLHTAANWTVRATLQPAM